MNRKSKLILSLGLFISLILISAMPAYSLSEATCIFLLIEPGSRPGGMGHSYVSIAESAFTNWWNPGGLAFIKNTNIDLMHTNWFGDVIDDIYYEYLGLIQHFEGIGTLGFNITFLTYKKLGLVLMNHLEHLKVTKSLLVLLMVLKLKKI